MDVPRGGPWDSALNDHLYFAVWRSLLADGLSRRFDAVVKVDSDTVLHAPRLRSIVDSLISSSPAWRTAGALVGMSMLTAPGQVSQNHYRFPGPLEVLSSSAWARLEQWLVLQTRWRATEPVVVGQVPVKLAKVARTLLRRRQLQQRLPLRQRQAVVALL